MILLAEIALRGPRRGESARRGERLGRAESAALIGFAGLCRTACEMAAR